MRAAVARRQIHTSAHTIELAMISSAATTVPAYAYGCHAGTRSKCPARPS
jgi:hypothetical protein